MNVEDVFDVAEQTIVVREKNENSVKYLLAYIYVLYVILFMFYVPLFLRGSGKCILKVHDHY
jgi:hypothetical protein